MFVNGETYYKVYEHYNLFIKDWTNKETWHDKNIIILARRRP